MRRVSCLSVLLLPALAFAAGCSSGEPKGEIGSTPFDPAVHRTEQPPVDSLEITKKVAPEKLTPSPVVGTDDFVSAPAYGMSASGRGGEMNAGGGSGGGGGGTPAPSAGDANAGAGSGSSSTPRSLEETDLYRVEGDRLYYLNAYRGLLVIDITDVDNPKLLGRSAIFGQPVEMIVRNGVATVIVADWYGAMDNGTPFHGSIVRGLDATDPKNIKVLGEAKLGGWVRDARVVGDVLYAVSQDYGSYYGWGGGSDVTATEKVVVSSVHFGDGDIHQVSRKEFPGYGGIFHVSQNAIVVAYPEVTNTTQPWSSMTGSSFVHYADISDPEGAINLRGVQKVSGVAQAWGADNGRFNIDFDGRYARVVTCQAGYWWGCGSGGNLTLSTVDFANLDAPTSASELSISTQGYGVTARFANDHLYLASSDAYYGGPGSKPSTPVRIFSLKPDAPALEGTTSIDGSVWMFMPEGGRLFALGQEPRLENGSYWYGSSIALRYLDVSTPATPSVLGNALFGEGWAWTPAAGTFKAFGRNTDAALVALPFSGWSYTTRGYNNGVQLIDVGTNTIRTAGAASVKGWAERAVFAKGRVLAMSDLSLGVIDYSDRDHPAVKKEMTLARNVVDNRILKGNLDGKRVAQLSTDWWGYDANSSEFRVMPLADVEESGDGGKVLQEQKIVGEGARIYSNGNFVYVVTNAEVPIACSPWQTGPCTGRAARIETFDTSGGTLKSRSVITLPTAASWGWGYGRWGGCFAYDWYIGNDVIQVQGNHFAFRGWSWTYDADGKADYESLLYVVNLENPDDPKMKTVEMAPKGSWWGNMKAAGSVLYANHARWIPPTDDGGYWTVKYYLDKVDLADPNPYVSHRINVPGLFVGASEKDPDLIYTMDYRYGPTGQVHDDLSVLRVVGDKAKLVGNLELPGYVGTPIVRGEKLYATVQHYQWEPPYSSDTALYEVDLSKPSSPTVRATTPRAGWGWLVDVVGDRAFVTSGWSGAGLDIYRLKDNVAPAYDQFVRTRGYWPGSLTRSGQDVLLANGYWGSQLVKLQ